MLSYLMSNEVKKQNTFCNSQSIEEYFKDLLPSLDRLNNIVFIIVNNYVADLYW